MRIKTAKQWYWVYGVAWGLATVAAFIANGNTKHAWSISFWVGVFIAALVLQTWNDERRMRDEEQSNADRKAKIDQALAAMDEAMRWGRSAFRHDTDPWDDGEFNPTVYAEYVAGPKKYLVRCYTLWGTMSVYEQVERSKKIGLDAVNKEPSCQKQSPQP